MKRGFTLVELLAVIIIIGIIFAITFPLITNNIKISEERAYNLQIEQIIKATKDMIVKDLIEIPNDEKSITIYISELKRNGLLPIEMTNPKTKKIISNTSNVVITRTGNSYKYDVNIEDLNEESTTNQNEDAPIIRLNGNYVEYVEINTTYDDKGAAAYDKNGNEIDVTRQTKSGVDEVGTIDTSTKNTYKVIYSASDNGYTTTSVRTVVVRDTTAPIIIVPENNTLTQSEINGFNVKEGVYAIDNSNESIVVHSESSLSNRLGTYLILYTAEDSSGNKTSLKRLINVVDEMNLVVKKNGDVLYKYNTETLNEKIIDKQSGMTNIICNNDVKIEETSSGIKLTNLARKKSICNFSDSIATNISNMDDTKNYLLMLDDESFSTRITLQSSKNLLLNLNSKTITYSGSYSDGNNYSILNYGILTIDGNNGVINGENSIKTFDNSRLSINGGTYNYIQALGNSTLSIYNSTNKCTIDQSNCYPILLGDNSSTVLKNVSITSKGKALGLTSSAEASVYDSTFNCTNDGCLWDNSNKTLNIYNTSINSYGYSVRLAGNGILNIYSGTFLGNQNSVIRNDSTSGTINIIQTSSPIYISSLYDSWSPAILNRTSGTININGKQADNCTSS